MILRAGLACLIILAILAAGEWMWHRKIIRGELSRKFAHIIAGSFIAFLPYWINYRFVTMLAIGFVVVNLINRYERPLAKNLFASKTINRLMKPFKAVHSISRKSYGDIYLSIAVLICALIQPAAWVFASAILFVSLADGLAAVGGLALAPKFGGFYHVYKYRKSWVGTTIFLLVTVVILSVGIYGQYGSPLGAQWLVLVWLPIAAAVMENFSGYGLDNLLLPLLVVIALHPLQF